MISGPIDVSRETRIRLDRFVAEFQRWNMRTNLSADRNSNELANRHITDSLQLLELAPPFRRWVDIGTGGGFPGAILAIATHDDDREIHLVESNGKKAAFLRSACLAAGITPLIHAERAETFITRTPPPDIVSARAVATLDKLLELCEPWLSGKTLGVFPKGQRAREEIAEAKQRWQFDFETCPSRTASDASILLVRNLQRSSRP